MIATESALGVHPSTEYIYFIVTGPVGAYYAKGFEPVSILVEENYIRATRGGLGEAKTGEHTRRKHPGGEGGQGEGVRPVPVARRGAAPLRGRGRDDIHLFVFGGERETPPLPGAILPGATRDSVIELAREWKIPVYERPVEIDEVIRRAEDGSLTEAFGSGTAAVISPVGAFAYRGQEVRVGDGKVGELSLRFYEGITGIQYGEVEDRHRWVHRVE
jgi:branched-chain amino acid aminotransferase